MKKAVSLLLILIIAVMSLCACGVGKEYVIATDDSFLPFSSKSLAGEAVGFEPELMKMIADIEDIKIKIIPAGLLDSLYALEHDDADAVIAAIIPTDEFVEKFDFSDCYFNEYALAVSKGKNNELLNKFNNGLQKLIENGKYNELIEKYALGEMQYE